MCWNHNSCGCLRPHYLLKAWLTFTLVRTQNYITLPALPHGSLTNMCQCKHACKLLNKDGILGIIRSRGVAGKEGLALHKFLLWFFPSLAISLLCSLPSSTLCLAYNLIGSSIILETSDVL